MLRYQLIILGLYCVRASNQKPIAYGGRVRSLKFHMLYANPVTPPE